MTEAQAFEKYLKGGYDDIMSFYEYCFNVLKIGLDFDESKE